MEFVPTDLPIENEYPKLIRDRIPEIIGKKGLTAGIKKLETDDEYLSYLLKKVVEESTELEYSQAHGNMQEELADVLELVQAILKVKGWTMEDVAVMQKEKREKNGGFDERLVMLELPK